MNVEKIIKVLSDNNDKCDIDSTKPNDYIGYFYFNHNIFPRDTMAVLEELDIKGFSPADLEYSNLDSLYAVYVGQNALLSFNQTTIPIVFKSEKDARAYMKNLVSAVIRLDSFYSRTTKLAIAYYDTKNGVDAYSAVWMEI